MKIIVNNIKEYKFYYAVCIFLLLVESATLVLYPQLINTIIDVALPYEMYNYLVQNILLIGIVIIISTGSSVIYQYIFSLIGNDFSFKLQIKTLEKLYSKYGEAINPIKDKVITIVNSDIDLVQNFITRSFPMIILDITTFLVVGIYLAKLNPTILFGIITVSVVIPLVQKIINKYINKFYLLNRELLDKTNFYLKEFISSIYEYIGLDSKKYFIDKYKENELKNKEAKIKLSLMFNYSTAVPSLIDGIITMIILGVGSYQVIQGSLSLADLFIFMLYSQKISIPITRMSILYGSVQQLKVSLNRIEEII